MFTGIEATGYIVEQGKINNYNVDIEFSLPIDKENKLTFSGYLSKPKSLGTSGGMSSFAEAMRNASFSFVENNEIFIQVESNKEGEMPKRMVRLTGDSIYNSFMQMMIEAIGDIKEKKENLFFVRIKDKEMDKFKAKAINAIESMKQEQSNLEKEERRIDIEIAKTQARIEAKNEVLKSMGGMSTPISISHQPNTNTAQPSKTAIIENTTDTRPNKESTPKNSSTNPFKRQNISTVKGNDINLSALSSTGKISF